MEFIRKFQYRIIELGCLIIKIQLINGHERVKGYRGYRDQIYRFAINQFRVPWCIFNFTPFNQEGQNLLLCFRKKHSPFQKASIRAFAASGYGTCILNIEILQVFNILIHLLRPECKLDWPFMPLCNLPEKQMD